MDNKRITNIKDMNIRIAEPNVTEVMNVISSNRGIPLADELISCPEICHCNTESVIAISEFGTLNLTNNNGNELNLLTSVGYIQR
jgi:hypothetical protein